MSFPSLENYGYVVSVSPGFLSNSKGDVSFNQTISDYSRGDWVNLRDHLRDFPWRTMSKLDASTAPIKLRESPWN